MSSPLKIRLPLSARAGRGALGAAFALALPLALAAMPLTTTKASAQEPPRASLTVIGEGEASATPDLAIFTTGVVTSAKTADEALAANSKVMANVIAAIRDTGIASQDIATSGLSVQPQYSTPAQNSKEPPRVVGYEVRNAVTVQVRALASVGPLLDKVVQAGANQAGGLRFTLSDPNALLRKARETALQDAMDQARDLAKAAGVRLLRVRRIAPVDTPSFAPRPMMMHAAAAASVPMEPGETSVRAGITLVYDVEPL